MTWCNSQFGRKYDITQFTPEMVHVDDMAYALASKMRYNGHLRVSSAQHSVAVLAAVEVLVGPKLTKNEARFVLYHDGSDAYAPDIPAPLMGRDEVAPLVALVNQVQACVYLATQVNLAEVSQFTIDALEVVDHAIRDFEAKHFHTIHPDWKHFGEIPQKVRGVLTNALIHQWDPPRAERKFLEVAGRAWG